MTISEMWTAERRGDHESLAGSGLVGMHHVERQSVWPVLEFRV